MSPKPESEPDVPEQPRPDPDELMAMLEDLRKLGGGASREDILAEVRKGREPRYPPSFDERPD